MLRAETELDKNLVAPHADESDFQRVIERLADEGLLQRNNHDALTVAKPRARSRRSASFFEDYSAQGRTPTTRTLSLEIVPLEDCPAFVQDALAQTDCSMLIRHHHVQCVDEIPHAIADSYIPYDLIRSEWKNIKDGESDLHKTQPAESKCRRRLQTQPRGMKKMDIIVDKHRTLAIDKIKTANLLFKLFWYADF